MTRAGIITQARMGSTRLPGKIMLRAGGRTLLDLQADRLAASGFPLLVATTTAPADDAVAAWCRGRDLPCFRGSEEDVLSRFLGCAREHGLDAVVRVTSDCPLIDGRLVGRAARRYLEAGDPRLYLSNVVRRTFPRGLDLEVFSAELLEEAGREARSPALREHVTTWMRGNLPGDVRHEHLLAPDDASGYRLTVDEPADLELIRRLVEEHRADRLDAAGLVALLRARPDLAAINAGVEQKAG